jgi:hypothetical protein
MQPTQIPKTINGKNPLAGYMRHPKIYIRLPSQGNFWPAKSIVYPENGELPVYSMTAKDELMFKTPDALLNGQAIVDVIQSCIPNIKNAWEIPVLDLDTILIAIRLATYGERMPIKHKIPVINDEVEHDLDLRQLLDSQSNNMWINQVAISDEMVVFVKPLTYRHLTKTSLKAFETRRIMDVVNDESVSDEKKLEVFSNSFSSLTKVTVELLAESIYKIVTPDDEVTDSSFILEFVNNADKEIFDKINNHLTMLKSKNELKPLRFETTEEQQALGAPASYETPVNFNESDFFGQGF